MPQIMSLMISVIFSLNVSFVEKIATPKEPIQSQNGIYTISASFRPGVEVLVDHTSFIKNGKIVWTKAGDGESYYYIGNNGTVVALVPEGDNLFLRFYDHNGNKKSEVFVAYPQGGSFTLDGEGFFFNSASGLSLFSKDGKVLANFGQCSQYAFSRDGRTVARSSGSEITVSKGEKTIFNSTLPSPSIRGMAMSEDGKSLAVIEHHNLFVYDLTQGRELYHLPVENPIVVSISPDGELIACAKETRLATSFISVSLFNRTGEKVWEWSNRFTKDYETVYRIDFTRDRFLNIYSTDDVFRFRIGE